MAMIVHTGLGSIAQNILPKGICSGYATNSLTLQPIKPFRQHNRMGGKVKTNIPPTSSNRATSVKGKTLGKVSAKVGVRTLGRVSAKVKVKALGRVSAKAKVLVRTPARIEAWPKIKVCKGIMEIEATNSREISSRPD